MADGHSFRDNQPMGQLGRMPIYMSVVLAIVHCVGFFLTMPTLTPETGGLFQEFTPLKTFHEAGHWWQPLTYAQVGKGDLFMLLSIVMLGWAGLHVEKFFGRWVILKLYGLLLLTAPLVSTLCWLAGYDGENLTLAGCSTLSFGMFAAFATLYPRIEVATLTLRTVFLILLALGLAFAARDKNWVTMLALLASCGVASVYILRIRHGSDFSFARIFQGLGLKSEPRMRVLPDPPRRKVSTVPLSPKTEEEDVDALLDKIAKSGLASLTAAERRKLEAARQELLKKERR